MRGSWSDLAEGWFFHEGVWSSLCNCFKPELCSDKDSEALMKEVSEEDCWILFKSRALSLGGLSK